MIRAETDQIAAHLRDLTPGATASLVNCLLVSIHKALDDVDAPGLQTVVAVAGVAIASLEERLGPDEAAAKQALMKVHRIIARAAFGD